MLTILHVSDLHFGPVYVPELGEALLRSAHALEPDVIVASGDFTLRARRDQYAAARRYLDRLPPVPLVTVPGNHDVPLYRVFERILHPYRNYREAIAPELESVLDVPGAIIVALNTTAPLRTIVNGRITERQVRACERAFDSADPDAARIVVAHHHFAPAPDYEGGSVMHGARAALERFQTLHVDLILGGHLHRAYIGNSLDVYPGRDRRHGVIIVQSGTTTSRRGRAREREKNSFNLLRIGEDLIRITHYMHFHELEGFAPVSRHVFPRAGRDALSPPAEQVVEAGRTSRDTPRHDPDAGAAPPESA